MTEDGRWIPVEEALPQNWDRVLVWDVQKPDYGTALFYRRQFLTYYPMIVTHWWSEPLPYPVPEGFGAKGKQRQEYLERGNND